MKLTVSTNQENLKDTGAGGLINKSGIYDVTLNYVQVAETKNKAVQLNFNVTHAGMEQTIWGPILIGKDGKVNEITQGLLNKLCVIAGMADGQEIETEEVTKQVGKDKKEMEMEIIPELQDIELKMRIQMEYSRWNDSIQENKAIKAFYREDGATAAEATSGENIGARLEVETEKYANNVTYKDGLTEEEVQEWIKNRSSNKAAPKKTGGAAKAKRPLFQN
jgi:hypothetical protein